ncbi:DUF6124 family protein [Pseudomonas fragi]|uniref:DUF6124 family protein n=1 Tax=Pseudomonas fragi TaxID=296 RepID=UPI003918464C
MLKITPDPPRYGTFVSAPTDELLQDRAAAKRALNFYLRDTPAPAAGTRIEDALVQACGLLRCASASAVEASNHLEGAQRDLVLSVLHLVDMATTQVDISLNILAAR